MHKPVLLNKVMDLLALKAGQTVLDGTVGCGGHSAAASRIIGPTGRLIGLDRDEEAIRIADSVLAKEGMANYTLVKSDFRDFDKVLGGFGIEKVDAAIFDFGVSSLQLDTGERGFSMQCDGPLDMRMDRADRLTAYEVVNRYSETKLADMIFNYGEERCSRRVAKAIVEARRKGPISTTFELVSVIKQAIGFKYRKLKIHPATRTFQAIRIEVNRELEAIREAISKLPLFLAKGARVCIISFHSLEDRIVKHAFRDMAKRGVYRLLEKKPFVPDITETHENARSRSAKLRAAEHTGQYDL